MRTSRAPIVEWKCSECQVSETEHFRASTTARSFFQTILWHHEKKSPACSGLNIAMEVPYEVLSKDEMKEWEEKAYAEREKLRAKGIAARDEALKAKAAKKGKSDG